MRWINRAPLTPGIPHATRPYVRSRLADVSPHPGHRSADVSQELSALLCSARQPAKFCRRQRLARRRILEHTTTRLRLARGCALDGWTSSPTPPLAQARRPWVLRSHAIASSTLGTPEQARPRKVRQHWILG